MLVELQLVPQHTAGPKILFLLIMSMAKCNLVKMLQPLVCGFQSTAGVLLEFVSVKTELLDFWAAYAGQCCAGQARESDGPFWPSKSVYKGTAQAAIPDASLARSLPSAKST